MTREIQKRLERLEQSAADRATLESWPESELDADGNIVAVYLTGTNGKPVRATMDDLV